MEFITQLLKNYNRNLEKLDRIAIKSPERKKKCKNTRDIPYQLYIYNADNHNTTTDISIDCESDSKEDTDNNENLYLYIKTIT